jgi:hypothetical protein
MSFMSVVKNALGRVFTIPSADKEQITAVIDQAETDVISAIAEGGTSVKENVGNILAAAGKQLLSDIEADAESAVGTRTGG